MTSLTATHGAPDHLQRQVWRDMTLFDGLHTSVEPMAVIVEGSRIAQVCAGSALSAEALADTVERGRGGVLTPGLIDCHTHLVYGGNRAREFELRLEGATYEAIARAGGGIMSTVRATRAADENALLTTASRRLAAMMADGATTVEIKSGYGLTLADELKLLRVARELGRRHPVRIVTTLLGAHALPPEYAGRSDDYIRLVCEEMIPAAARDGLVDAVDVFCENIAFSVAQCERVWEAAAAHRLAVKGHVEQLSNMRGAVAAARRHALSADHLEYLAPEDVPALRDAGTVAVLLPGAFYCLRETRQPPIAALRAAGVPMAVATDANPGTSPIVMPTLALNLACTQYRLTPREALAGMTAHAARALGLADRGHIAAGAVADLCWWDVETPAELAYAVQPGRLRQRIFEGRITHEQA
jgi:imidazolonepropionase